MPAEKFPWDWIRYAETIKNSIIEFELDPTSSDYKFVE